MKRTKTENTIAALIAPAIGDRGLELVDVSLGPQGQGGYTLQIMLENPETGSVSLEECTHASRAIAAILDVEDPIKGQYRLEVTSPGIDRPLTRPQDFDRFEGREAKIELDAPLNGQKRFKGRLGGRAAENVALVTDTGPVTLPIGSIEKARLVLTDELIRWSAQQRNERLNGEKSHDGNAASR